MLHVTNGDVAGRLLAGTFPGQVLPWRDVLHEGPVRAGLPLEALSAERARFAAEAGWGAFDEVLGQYRARDAALQESRTHDEVVLWFEHDLYDQLQLIQLLDFFASHSHPRVSLICEAEYVGHMDPGRMRALFAARQAVSDIQLQEARAAWTAFTAADPSGISLQPRNGLPFLAAALRRQLQEFPWTTDGLSLLERRTLDALAPGPLPWPRAFTAIREEPAFLGDLVFLWHLRRMEGEGLVARRGERCELVSRRRQKRLPRWLGGVRVDERCAWRWDPDAGRLVS